MPASLDADLWAGRAEALANGFIVEAGDAITFRHASIGRAVARDLLPVARTRHHAALAAGLDGTTGGGRLALAGAYDPLRGPGRGDRGGRLRRRASRRGRRAGGARARAGPRRQPGGSGRGAPAGGSRTSDRVELQVRASEAAFAVGRTSRATAFLEAAIGGLDARRDRVRLGLLHERLAQIRRAAGDPAGAMHAARRAVELVPREPSPERATVLAGLAQLKMLDGIFSEAQRLAREAIKVARACDPVARAQEIHATTTLAVASPGAAIRTASIDLLREAEVAAIELDDPDALFRIRANLTTVLDLVGPPDRGGRRRVRGHRGRPARRARGGLRQLPGAANVADSLFLLGRWPEARALSERAMSWLPVGVVYLAAVLQLAIVEIETDAGEEASRLLGQTILEFDAVREPQLAGPYYLAAASFALWRGDIADASRSVDRGWASVRETEEWVLVARMAAMVAQVDAAVAAEAREHRQLAPLAAARQRTAEVLAKAAELVRAVGAPLTAGSRRVAEASLATARAYQRRLEGEDDAAVWRRVAAAGPRSRRRTTSRSRAGARPRRSSPPASGGRAGRARRRRCWRRSSSALRLGAKPLLRELRELAGRARIVLPAEVDDCSPTRPPSIGTVERVERRRTRRGRSDERPGPTWCARSPAIRPTGDRGPTRSG